MGREADHDLDVVSRTLPPEHAAHAELRVAKLHADEQPGPSALELGVDLDVAVPAVSLVSRRRRVVDEG